ncbi:MAG: hypothetical protein HY699_12945 [Deltaproteobacteria bacterium]|nr:hypothetical protein [Deltaproteobacteria bacterium]
MLFGFDTNERGGPADDLISLVITKQLDSPFGRATLNFVPREPVAGYNWADLIPSYSLIEIFLSHAPIAPEPVLVFLGLTGARIESANWEQAAPERQVQVAARELTCIFVDQKALYLPVRPELLRPDIAKTPFTDALGRGSVQPATETLKVGEGKTIQQLVLPATASPALTLKDNMVAIDPILAKVGESPVDAIANFVKMVTVGLKSDYNPTAMPLLNLGLFDAALRGLLFFDREKAKGQLFDPLAALPAAAQVSTDSDLWQIMSGFVDPHYQELFAVPRDQNSPQREVEVLSPSAMEVIFRKPPFGGRITGGGELIGIRDHSGSQFDREFETDPVENVAISDQHLLNSSLLRSEDAVQNLFYIQPGVPSINTPEDWRAIHSPLIDLDPLAPSSARRFGLRLQQWADYYLHQAGDSAADPRFDPEQRARVRELMVYHWHRFEPLFYRGHYGLVGNPFMQVGKRAVHKGLGVSREYYIAAVTHSLTIGTQRPRYTTTIGVERGWPIY